MIQLFTDFGYQGPYVGEMKAAILQEAPDTLVIDLMHDAPAFNAKAAAYLLAVLSERFPQGSTVLGVVDPGVGGARDALVVESGGHFYVGPDNGLFEIIQRRSSDLRTWSVTWRPEKLSASFHGRDLFAPVAARVASGKKPQGVEKTWDRQRFAHWPDDLPEIVYIDGFGNCVTGVRASACPASCRVQVNGRDLSHAQTFSDAQLGAAFWYENSSGLVELAVNQGRADKDLGLVIGTSIAVL